MQVEYWVSNNPREEGGGTTILAPLMPGQLPVTPSGGGKKDKDKENVKVRDRECG